MEELGDSTFLVTDSESRFVTLLSLDLVNSTGISASVSPGDELDLHRTYKLAVENLLDLEDVKLEWTGDGALVCFGFPRARVDAAETAIRTGLQLIESINRVRVLRQVALELRIGIASGRVTIDKIRKELARVILASRADRIRAHAHPGQLLIGDDTRRLVRDFFEYEDRGVADLKGTGPRRLWRVLRESSVRSRFAAKRLAQSTSEVVGREGVLSKLSEVWSAVLRGRASAVCLVGESGIGKSRLARAVREWAERDGAEILEIDCTPSAGNSPMLPIGVLLRRIAGIGTGVSDAEKEQTAMSLLARLLGEHDARESWGYLAPLFGVESSLLPLDKTREQTRAATVATLIAMVRAVAAQAPLAIICEDLQWADDSTAHVVQRLVARIGAPGGELRERPIMLLVTRWPQAVTRVDLETVTAAFTTLAIEPLPDLAAAQFVQVVARGRLSSERVDDIVDRCGGVPLLLEEVTRSTIEQADSDASVRTVQSHDSAVPPELQLVVESRLEQEPELRGVIEAASVFGREFPVPALESLVGAARARVAPALSRFQELGLFAPLDPERPDRASFRHALIRDAVYETVVSNEHLRRLHSGAADALRSKYQGTPDASADALAHHLRLGRRFAEAVKVRLAAGQDAFDRGAYVEATGHGEAVRTLLTELGDQRSVRPDTVRWCTLRGMVETGIHGYSAETAQDAYREAYEMFDVAIGPDLRYPVIRGLATASLVRGDLRTAHDYARQGLELAEQSQRADLRIDAMSVLAYTTLYFGRLADSRMWLHRCLELYEKEDGHTFRYPVPQDAKTAALALLPTVAWLLGDAPGAEDAIAQGREHVERLGRNFDRALLHAWIAGTRYTQRRYQEALGHAHTAYALGKEHNFQEWEGVGAMLALLSQSASAPAPEAVALAADTATKFGKRNIGLNASYYLWGIARGYVTANDPAAASTTLDTALRVAAVSGETRMHPEIWMLQSEIETDRLKRLGLLRQAYDLAESQAAVANALRAAAMLVRAGGRTADREWAGLVLDLLDGRRSEPSRPNWMCDELERGRAVLAAMASA